MGFPQHWRFWIEATILYNMGHIFVHFRIKAMRTTVPDRGSVDQSAASCPVPSLR